MGVEQFANLVVLVLHVVQILLAGIKVMLILATVVSSVTKQTNYKAW
jgi:hypothetical protein